MKPLACAVLVVIPAATALVAACDFITPHHTAVEHLVDCAEKGMLGSPTIGSTRSSAMPAVRLWLAVMPSTPNLGAVHVGVLIGRHRTAQATSETFVECRAGGMTRVPQEFLDWMRPTSLRVGDIVTVKVVDVPAADEPVARRTESNE